MTARIPYRPERPTEDALLRRLQADLETAERRRTVREFSTDPVPRAAIETAIRIASTAPSGAHRQPWTFVAISDPALKQRIREAAEAEEREFYAGRASPEWLAALEPLGTDFVKTHLTDAPWLIVVFAQIYEPLPDGGRSPNYYVVESVGIAVGFLLQALHSAGLCALTHTPAPMTFIRKLLHRPSNERPFVIIPVGYAAEGCTVPDIRRKSLAEVLLFLEE